MIWLKHSETHPFLGMNYDCMESCPFPGTKSRCLPVSKRVCIRHTISYSPLSFLHPSYTLETFWLSGKQIMPINLQKRRMEGTIILHSPAGSIKQMKQYSIHFLERWLLAKRIVTVLSFHVRNVNPDFSSAQVVSGSKFLVLNR